MLTSTFPSRDTIQIHVANHSVMSKTVARRPYCFAEVTTNIRGMQFKGYGFSKVCWPDEWNAEGGCTLATVRALEDLTQRLEAIWDREEAEEQYALALLQEEQEVGAES